MPTTAARADSHGLASRVREELAAQDAELAAMLAAGQDGRALGEARAAALDAMFGWVFEAACEAHGCDPARAPLTLAAAGSYGRGALAARSDVDVRLVVRDRPRRAAGLADAILYPLWDAGMVLGHQIVQPREVLTLARTDLATATSLFDLRPIAGDAEPVRRLVARFVGGMRERPAIDFAARLAADIAERHARFGTSVYLLEPDVKNGAGGARDLECARWAAKARFPAAREGDALAALIGIGVLDARELAAVAAADEFLWRVRNRLHTMASRRSERLTFEAQEAVALAVGYDQDDGRAAAAERMMQDYYLHARAIGRVCDRVVARAGARPRGRVRVVDLGGGLLLRGGEAAVARPEALREEPVLALRVLGVCARRGVPLAQEAQGAVARAAQDPAFGAALRASPEAASLFVELLCTVADTPVSGGSVVREMHELGLLLAMIPEFVPVTGRVHHDVYHVLTVDVHSVATVDCLRALARGELAAEHTLASRLAAEVARPRPLFLAALLHDVGKGYPDASGSRRNHSQAGADLCDVVLPRLGLRPEEVAETRALVLHHLAMYHAATRRDLDDPATIAEFARLVRGREGLRDLYLLTLADISTTSPQAMTSWKARMLEELYLRADEHLAGARDHVYDDERVARLREEAHALFEGDAAELDAFVAAMPMRYLLATPPAAVAAHARTVREADGKPVHVALGPARHADTAELVVVAADRPGLLARIAAALTASRLQVHAAEIHGASLGGRAVAVDVFFVRDPVDGAAGAARRLPRVRADLTALCEGRTTPEELLEARTGSRSPWRERPTPAVPSKVVIDERGSSRHTIVEVFAKDQPGLLFRLARALEQLGLSITLSKINTEGTKVADVFYVNELDGSKVEGRERLAAIRDRLLSATGE